MRRLRPIVFAVLAAVMTGCSVSHPSGATLQGGVPAIVVKRCVPPTVIGSVTLYRGDLRSDDADDLLVVWQATLEADAGGALRIPIAREVPGYRVDDDTGGPLSGDEWYSAEIRDSADIYMDTVAFRPKDLFAGRIFLREDDVTGDLVYVDDARWNDDDSDCPETFDEGVRVARRVAVIGGSALLALLVAIGTILVVVLRRKRDTKRPVPVARTVLCPNGHPSAPGDRFCRSCGAPVDRA